MGNICVSFGSNPFSGSPFRSYCVHKIFMAITDWINVNFNPVPRLCAVETQHYTLAEVISEPASTKKLSWNVSSK